MHAKYPFQHVLQRAHLHENPTLMPSLAEILLIMSHTCPTGMHGHDCAVAGMLTSQGGIAVSFVDMSDLDKMSHYHEAQVWCNRNLVPLLAGASPPASRQGAVNMVGSLVQQLGTSLVPYLLLLVVPLMGRMSDPDPAVRQLATATFAPVVALLPLAQVQRHCAHACLHMSCRVLAAADPDESDCTAHHL
jgi:hypothetical protein